MNILEFVDKYGSGYNTRDFSFYIYSLIRMSHPDTFVEFGTGYGVTAFMAAHAMKENNKGKTITFDNGAYWKNEEPYEDFISKHIKQLDIQNFIETRNDTLNPFDYSSIKDIDNIDIIFSDYEKQPSHLNALLTWALPRVKSESIIIIDSAATFWPSYTYLKNITEQFNQNKIPKMLLDNLPLEEKDKIINFIFQHDFIFVPSRKIPLYDDLQNSFASVYIRPTDLMF